MKHSYILLAHQKPENAHWFVVNWCLGNICNFSCSYCPDGLHNGSIKWPELETVKKFVTEDKEIQQV